METFGNSLLARGVVSPEQVRAASRVMVVIGGRLGTALVESGALTLDQLETQLAIHLKLPAAPLERLQRPQAEALEALSAELAERHGAFPMWLEKRTLHVALRDPQDGDRNDELAFATSHRIQPYVVAERRLASLLERHYRIRPDQRFSDARLIELAGHVPSPDAAPAASRGLALEVAEIGPLPEGEDLSPAEDIGLGAEARVAGPPAASSPGQVAELESELVLTAPRSALVPLVLRIAGFYASAVAFFAVRDSMIQGLQSAGELSLDRVAGIYLPLSAPCLLSAPARSGRSVRARPAGDGVDAELMRALGRSPKEVAVIPIRLAERVASLLYVDNGPHPLAASGLAALEAVADTVTAAYERLLLPARELC